MMLLYPYDANEIFSNEYQLIEPTPEDRVAILEGSRFLDPLPAPSRYNLVAFKFGGYNTYSLDNSNPLTRATRFSWPYVDTAHELTRSAERGFIPSPRMAELPVSNADPSWDYSIPYYNDINANTGALTGSTFNPSLERGKNYALPFFKNLVPAKGGTDILAAIRDAADTRVDELRNPGNRNKKAILVLATDGAPDSRCNSSILSSSRPGATCAGRTFLEDMAGIRSELSRFENGGNTLVILLHMQHGRVDDNLDHVREFTALFKNTPENTNPNGRFYFPLGNLTQSNIAEQLQAALQIIYQKIDSFAVFEE
jgi:hypothetical protein